MVKADRGPILFWGHKDKRYVVRECKINGVDIMIGEEALNADYEQCLDNSTSYNEDVAHYVEMDNEIYCYLPKILLMSCTDTELADWMKKYGIDLPEKEDANDK